MYTTIPTGTPVKIDPNYKPNGNKDFVQKVYRCINEPAIIRDQTFGCFGIWFPQYLFMLRIPKKYVKTIKN